MFVRINSLLATFHNYMNNVGDFVARYQFADDVIGESLNKNSQLLEILRIAADRNVIIYEKLKSVLYKERSGDSDVHGRYDAGAGGSSRRSTSPSPQRLSYHKTHRILTGYPHLTDYSPPPPPGPTLLKTNTEILSSENQFDV
jgi:hypothetical protein